MRADILPNRSRLRRGSISCTMGPMKGSSSRATCGSRLPDAKEEALPAVKKFTSFVTLPMTCRAFQAVRESHHVVAENLPGRLPGGQLWDASVEKHGVNNASCQPTCSSSLLS